MRGDRYQIALIALGVVATVLVAIFFLREVAPEYRLYQDAYIALEEFRSSYTGEPPAPFAVGIKQIVIEKEDKGPPEIDRCISCHVALKLPHFSKTTLKRDVNGNLELDAEGFPVHVPNPEYIWAKLDEKIASLPPGREADRLALLREAHVDGVVYDMTRVLAAHPLIGRETRPFEFHPMEEYGCVACHNGNGRGLTTEKAHGPVFDGQYHAADEGPRPVFTESDRDNDPLFARIFNGKPGHHLLFQTTPLYAGALIEAKCMQCHLNAVETWGRVTSSTAEIAARRNTISEGIAQGLQRALQATEAFADLKRELIASGYAKTEEKWRKQAGDYTLPPETREAAEAQFNFLQRWGEGKALSEVRKELLSLVGSEELVKTMPQGALTEWVAKNRTNPAATGTLFERERAYNLDREIARHVLENQASFAAGALDEKTIGAMESDVDLLTRHFALGQQLFLSQGCYACHRIAGFSRGGVGPELSNSGNTYPWFLKESIVWPQADLSTSTMPNYRLDHEELEALVTYLLGQKGERKAVAEAVRKGDLQAWEGGKKLPWELPATPTEITDVRYGMTVFATEGCAACHRLEGFESDVGFAIEKGQKPEFNTLYQEREWFRQLFPEALTGSQIVAVLEQHSAEVDRRIVDAVRKGSLLEEIEEKFPDAVESLYTPFKFALRAKNTAFKNDPKALAAWKARVRRVLKVFVQEYGLGRLICPRPNWSGVFRSDQWLMEHFKNPALHTPRSLMPVFPFDDTKFLALTYMLDVLGRKNRDSLRTIWEHTGFNPAQAYERLCAQCHGTYLEGNGPVAEWIYPIPKNLRNAEFLRNLTYDKVKFSIEHGVKGTPMPPWGEAATDKLHGDAIPVLTEDEIHQLVDWIFSSLPGGHAIPKEKEVPKWQYDPDDVERELREEGALLGMAFLASLKPIVPPPEGVFEQVPNPDEPGGYHYYIRQKYYTPENLAAGKAFFELNCAICHGKEADGTGLRAGTMFDAKPRMLVNLNWSAARDDLRFLRSIKYGVAGTSMTPWGDLTTSFQRIQLVIFIRSLMQQARLREELLSSLYTQFDVAAQAVDVARAKEFAKLEALDGKLVAVIAERREAGGDAAVSLFAEEIKLKSEREQQRAADIKYAELKTLILKEKEMLQGFGATLLTMPQLDALFRLFVEYIQARGAPFTLNNSHLMAHSYPAAALESLQQSMLQLLDQTAAALEQEQSALAGKGASLASVNREQGQVIELKRKLITAFEEGKRIDAKEMTLYNEIAHDNL